MDSNANADSYDAILVVSFGGPESKADVIPFLENVLRGRNVPRERMLEVAEHYYHFDGRSPINDHCRGLIAALTTELQQHNIDLPIYWGNRNWHPMLPATVQQMADDGIQRALAFFTSAYSSYSGCRQYRENIIAAREAVGDSAPEIHKLRMFFNHPDFIELSAERLRSSIQQLPPALQQTAQIAFTAHSIPSSMANGCDYELQLTETCRLVCERLEIDSSRWDLVYQSRSGRPTDPWLEPDICDHLHALHERGLQAVVVDPIGFLSDHLEVLYDLDHEAQEVSDELGITMVRTETVGNHPQFIAMIRKLIQERLLTGSERPACGTLGPSHDVCPPDCCPAPARRRP